MGLLSEIPGHHLKDSMPPTTNSDLWVMRQKKMLALAWTFKACAEASGAPKGILCGSSQRTSMVYGSFDDPEGR